MSVIIIGGGKAALARVEQTSGQMTAEDLSAVNKAIADMDRIVCAICDKYNSES